MAVHDRQTNAAAGRAPEGPDPELLAVMLLEFNDRLLERLTLGGTLRREQLIDGAEAIWMRTIYGAIADIDTRPTSSSIPRHPSDVTADWLGCGAECRGAQR